jgi:hypothetical protein
MIDQSTNLKTELLSILEEAPYYYLKSPSIVRKITKNGRIFYSKYHLLEESVNQQIKKDYLNGKISIATPLGDNEIFIRYFNSENRQRFLYIFRKILRDFKIKREIFFIDEMDVINILISFEQEEKALNKILEIISKNLEKVLEKEWKILPDKSLPKDYNIFIFPDQKLFSNQ